MAPVCPSGQFMYIYAITKRLDQAAADCVASPCQQQVDITFTSDCATTLPATGINGTPVTIVSAGALSAVVSAMPSARVRPERANLTSHNQIQKNLMETHTVLPVAFGTIADSPGAVKTFLIENEKNFIGQLDTLDGKIEMGLRVRFDVLNVFEFFVRSYPELKALRDAVFGSEKEPDWEVKIELGRKFERLLERERNLCTVRIMEAISSACTDTKRNPPRNNHEVLNIACLIKRQDAKQLDHSVSEIADQFDEHYVFDMTGPWAPYNFVHLDLKI